LLGRARSYILYPRTCSHSQPSPGACSCGHRQPAATCNEPASTTNYITNKDHPTKNQPPLSISYTTSSGHQLHQTTNHHRHPSDIGHNRPSPARSAISIASPITTHIQPLLTLTRHAHTHIQILLQPTSDDHLPLPMASTKAKLLSCKHRLLLVNRMQHTPYLQATDAIHSLPFSTPSICRQSARIVFRHI